MERVNASGKALLTPTELDGRAVIRVSIGSPGTTEPDLQRLWDLLTPS
jgi:aromatic-L-amino-acid decarboxylase